MKQFLAFILAFGSSACYAQQHMANLERSAKIKAAEQQIVLLNNSAKSIPVTELRNLSTACVHIQDEQAAMFDSIVSKYHPTASIYADTVTTEAGFNALHDQLKLFSSIHVRLSSSTPFTPALVNFLRELGLKRAVVVVLSGGGKQLAALTSLRSPIIFSQTNTEESAIAAAQLIYGGIAATGRLNANYGFAKGAGFTTVKTRLGYSIPETVSLNSDELSGIDSVVNAGIAAHSAPSVVVLLVKDGKVIFHKAYGRHTYSNTAPATQPDDLFDLASITKVSATTQAVMNLYDKGLLKLEDPVSKYVAITRNIPDKKDIMVREALLHQAGYTPYIKFYEKLLPADMSRDSSTAYPTKVADGYFLRAHYFEDVMWPVTLASRVETRGKFVYSDVSMYMMKEVVENITHRPLNQYVQDELYAKLGLQTMGYLPRNRFPASRIAPTTENDNWFRNMLVQGYVNDPGAAMAGGVEGHAGLFADANDMAILYQMLLNKGRYGGVTYYKPATVELFTARQSTVAARGLGFAKADDKLPSTSGLASTQSYGHSGYTGTFVWSDPKYNIVYICLTNRVYPDDGKTYGPAKVNIRPLALDVFYKAVLKGAKE